jgi:hypothetical protein
VEQVRDEMASFPYGENDDLHDAAVYGLPRIRQGGLIAFRAISTTNTSRGSLLNTIEPGGNSRLSGIVMPSN